MCLCVFWGILSPQLCVVTNTCLFTLPSVTCVPRGPDPIRDGFISPSSVSWHVFGFVLWVHRVVPGHAYDLPEMETCHSTNDGLRLITHPPRSPTLLPSPNKCKDTFLSRHLALLKIFMPHVGCAGVYKDKDVWTERTDDLLQCLVLMRLL